MIHALPEISPIATITSLLFLLGCPPAPPVITGIDGDGTATEIRDVGGETAEIFDGVEAAHRFQQTWVVKGLGLTEVTAVTLAPDGWAGPTFTAADGLEFIQGGTSMQRTLLLPATLVSGAFILTLASGGAEATAQVYILQGEPGESADSLLECSGDDCTLTGYSNLIVEGGVYAASMEAVDLLTDTVTVREHYRLLAECPEGYRRDWAEEGIVLCYDAEGSGDEMVKVGNFWIDRFEASIWEDPGCTGTQYGTEADNYNVAEFPDTGIWSSPLYACSLENVRPSAFVTWYQAQQACELAGKDMCTNAQWQAAVSGTTIAGCNTGGSGEDEGCNGTPDPWPTGDTQCGGCESSWGAMDLVGNTYAWVTMWEGHPGWNGVPNVMTSEYGNDGYFAGGQTSDTMLPHATNGSWRPHSPAMMNGGMDYGDGYGPAAAIRGGYWESRSLAGEFTLNVFNGPGHSKLDVGVRCCRQF